MTRDISFIAALDFEQRSAGEVVDALLAAGFDSVEWTMAHVNDLLAPASALASQMDLVSGGEEAVEANLSGRSTPPRRPGIPVVNVLTGPNLWEEGVVKPLRRG